MKFFITCVSLCMTSVFYISEAHKHFFILLYPRIREFYSEWIPTTYFQKVNSNLTKSICENVKYAKIFIADRPMTQEPTSDNEINGARKYLESNFFSKKAWDSQISEIVVGKRTTVELLFQDKKFKSTVITCEFGKSEKDKIYVARQGGSEHYFLFGKTDEGTLPNLLAIGMYYMGIHTIERSKDIEDVIWQYTYNNDKAKSHRVAMKLFEEDGVDIFLLCASILYYEESKEDQRRNYKYIITIPGPRNNLGTEVPIKNIVKFIRDEYAGKSVPLLTCQIKQKVNNEYPIKFKFYIAPDVAIISYSRIFAMYEYLNGLKVTHVIKHYGLSSPWKFVNGKHPREEEETEN